MTENFVLGFVDISQLWLINADHSHGLDGSKNLSQMTSFADRLRV